MLLIDGDVVKYRAAFGAERTKYTVVYTDPEFDERVVIPCADKMEAKEVVASEIVAAYGGEIVAEKVYEPVSHAIANVDSIIERIMKQTDHTIEDTIVCLSGKTNFRDEVATIKPYKANREGKPQPTHGQACVLHMIDTYNCDVSEGEEADDVMGYRHMRVYREDPMGSIIATVDKDLDMVPGMHFNFVKEEYYYVDASAARVNFWKQMVTGDPTDNIPGIPGSGPAAATKMEAKGDLNREGILALYVQAYGGEDEGFQAFNEMGRLLWIRQEPEQQWTPELLET